jgi:hypothetical protein
MKKSKYSKLLLTVLAIVCLLAVFPLQGLAAGTENAAAPQTSDNSSITPPSNEISSDPDYSEGVVLTRSTVSGGCSITRLSSSSVNISGYTICSPSDPAVQIVLNLQAYYDGAWHTLASKSKSQSGTRVDLSQNYNVTSGYYYRVYAMHSIADGSTSYSYTNSIYVG